MMFRTGLKVVHTQIIKDLLMAIFLGVAFSIVAFTCLGCKSVPDPKIVIAGKELKNTDKIQMVYKNALLGEMTVKEFKTLLDAGESYSNILKAEKKENIKIELEDNPWEVKTTSNTFQTYASLVWFDDNKTVLKKVRFRIRLNKKDGSWEVSRIDEMYTKASRILFPTFTATTIVLIILLVILL